MSWKLFDATSTQTHYDHLSCLDYSASELASQITLFNQKQFAQVPNTEFIKSNFLNRESSPQLSSLGDWFNVMSLWIGTEVITAQVLKTRVSIITHLVSVAKELKKLKNWYGLFALISGLSMWSVSRLRMTWKSVPAHALAAFAKLSQLISPSRNFAVIRPDHDSVGDQCILSPVIFLKDLTGLLEGNEDWIEEKYINIPKLDQFGGYVFRIQQIRRYIFKFSPNDRVQKFLAQMLLSKSKEVQEAKSQELESLSNALEPPTRPSPLDEPVIIEKEISS